MSGLCDGKNAGREIEMVRYVKRSTNAPMRKCERLPMIGFRKGRGRPKKNWGEVIRQNMAHLHLTVEMTLDRRA